MGGFIFYSEPISKRWIKVQGKARGGAYTLVCEHFELNCNAALGL